MSVATENKSLWSVRETAAKLGISERSLHSLTSPRGELPCVKLGCRVLCRPESVDQWLKDREGQVEIKPTKPVKDAQEASHDA